MPGEARAWRLPGAIMSNLPGVSVMTPTRPDPRRRLVRRRAFIRTGAVTACWPARTLVAAPRCEGWPLWQAFLDRFVQADGRVIDDQHGSRYTTSEGMAYTMFFALVANDRPRFDTLLRWTAVHLAGGDLHARLPGWRWGRRDDGQWTLVDRNPAADADLWLAHTLLEAGRLWQAAEYRQLGLSLLARVRWEEVVDLPGAGPMLLPAPLGFHLGPGQWRFNPSYLPLHQLRALSAIDADGPWQRMVDGTLAMLRAAAPKGYVPDWINYDAGRGWHAGRESPAIGSYDAVRVYLWAGLIDAADPLRDAWLHTVRGMREYLEAGHPAPPQHVHTDTGAARGDSPPGFSGALLPYLQAHARPALLAAQQARVKAASAGAACPAIEGASGLVGQPPTYYDQVLTLFGQGALEGRYRFDAQGCLHVRW